MSPAQIQAQSCDKALRKVSAAQIANLATYQHHLMDATPYVNPLRNLEFLPSSKCAWYMKPGLQITVI